LVDTDTYTEMKSIANGRSINKTNGTTEKIIEVQRDNIVWYGVYNSGLLFLIWKGLCVSKYILLMHTMRSFP